MMEYDMIFKVLNNSFNEKNSHASLNLKRMYTFKENEEY